MVGSAMRCRIANRASTHAIAPAAPNRCPWIAFVALIGMAPARSPKTLRMADVSATSFAMVPVPCALIESTWSAVIPADCNAARIAEAYLVAEKIEGDGTMKELTMLAAAHGIGVIQLDSTAPTESQVMIPARERPDVDWEMCNRLAEENTDFVAYIERIKHFHQTGKVSRMEWGQINSL